MQRGHCVHSCEFQARPAPRGYVEHVYVVVVKGVLSRRESRANDDDPEPDEHRRGRVTWRLQATLYIRWAHHLISVFEGIT